MVYDRNPRRECGDASYVRGNEARVSELRIGAKTLAEHHAEDPQGIAPISDIPSLFNGPDHKPVIGARRRRLGMRPYFFAT